MLLPDHDHVYDRHHAEGWVRERCDRCSSRIDGGDEYYRCTECGEWACYGCGQKQAKAVANGAR